MACRYLTKHYNSRGYPQTSRFHQKIYFISFYEKKYYWGSFYKWPEREFYSMYEYDKKRYWT